jgi:predicted outer membrane repeat protein
MPNRLVVLVSGVLMMLSSRALAATWYVSGTGDDGNDCKTKATACATIGHAISLAASGDTIEIAPAGYQENLTIPFNLTLNGGGALTTVVDGGGGGDGGGGTVFTVGAGVSLTLVNLTIKHGVGYSGGGGVYNAGNLTVINSNFYVNQALSGGAILNTGTATFRDVNFDSNSPYFFGRTASCGAIDNRSTMTITNSTFYNNYANNNNTAGGAICNSGALSIIGSTFYDNQSQGNNGGYGGAIYASAGTLTLTNSTFYLNTATAGGGAIYVQGGTIEISNSTFGINAASGGVGGALNNAGGSFLIQNSIVANAGYGGNCAGIVTSRGYNLSSDSSCLFNGAGDRNGANPKLGSLGKHGGPTETMPLSKGSPALDAGNPAGCRDFAGNLLTTDQRGKPRPGAGDTAGCDMGAYESQTY